MRRFLQISLALCFLAVWSAGSLEAGPKGGGGGKGGSKKSASGRRTSGPTTQKSDRGGRRTTRKTSTRPSRTDRTRPTKRKTRSDRTTGQDRDRPIRGGRKHDATHKRRSGRETHDGELRTQKGRERFERRRAERDHGAGGELRGAGRDRIDRSSLEGLKGRDRAFELQRLNEEAKLNHRLDNAQRLRDLSERNGNARLTDTAQRMEDKAYDHYDRRMERIDQQQARFEGRDGDAGRDSTGDTGGDGRETDADDGHNHHADDHDHDAHDTDGHDADTGDDRSSHPDSPDDVAAPNHRDQVLDKQALNEQRKLDHRLQQAEHLREIAQRNGNTNLYDTADRMEQKAWSHYDRRMGRIESRRGRTGDLGDGRSDRDTGDFDSDDFDSDADDFDEHGDDPHDIDDGFDDDANLDDVDDRDSFRGSKFQRQLANEQRKLDHRLRQADHLRSIAQRNGNANLYDTADRMEQKAFDHYNRRLDKLGSQQGLSDLSTDPVPPDVRNPAWRGDLGRQLSYEEQRLRNRLDTAQQLRDHASRTGNEQLLDAADQLEQRALDDYERRVDATEQYDRYSQFDPPRYDNVFTPGEAYWGHYDPESYGVFRRVFGR